MKSSPYLTFTHCICHQLILGIKDIFKRKDLIYKNPIARDLQYLNDLVYKVGSYFTASSKRNIVLITFEEELLESAPVKMIRPFDIRWLSHLPAIERVLSLYPALIAALNTLIQTDKDFLSTVMKEELMKSSI